MSGGSRFPLWEGLSPFTGDQSPAAEADVVTAAFLSVSIAAPERKC